MTTESNPKNGSKTPLADGDALITGRPDVVAEGGPAPEAQPSGPGRPSHVGQGPRVKAHHPRSHPKYQLQDAWIALLSRRDFQWFGTFTFAKPVHPEAAFKIWRRFTNELNRKLYGRRWQRTPHQGIHWVLALEWQRRGVLHFHSLMGGESNLNDAARRLSWMDRWQELAGFARIEALRSNKDALRYVTKYVVKDGDIYISRNFGFCRPAGLLQSPG